MQSNDPSRQDATPHYGDPSEAPDGKEHHSPTAETDRYTLSVAEAVEIFRTEGLSLTDRTIQRYCQTGKLSALRVDPDTRLLTKSDKYVFVIDPASIPKRISQIREKQEFANPTVVATRREETRLDAKSRDNSRHDVADANPGMESEQVAKLQELINSLQIDKAVRDGLIKQLQDDRQNLFTQLEAHVRTMNEQSRLIGSLEAKLELSAPAPPTTSPEAETREGTVNSQEPAGVENFERRNYEI